MAGAILIRSPVKYALRSLLKSPGFTIIALLTLALGIGVNSSAFSVLNALLFATPYPADARLVRIFRTSPQSQNWPHSVANFLDHRAHNTVFERVAAVSWSSFTLTEPGASAERLRGLNVTADFFPLLGVQPERGRWFTEAEDQPGQSGVIVLSHGTWQRRFGGDPAIVGRQLRLNAESVTVVGVMPARVDFAQLWGQVDAWRPLAFSGEARQNRGSHYLGEIARLKPGVTRRQAQAEMDTLAARLAVAHPTTNAQNGLRLVPLAGSMMDGFGAQLTWLVMGLAVFVLLIACANLANLQFARHAARAREQAIRAALGASRWNLILAVLTESLLLSLAGGALGLLVALWCNDALGSRFSFGGSAGLPLPLDLRALAFTFLASLATGLTFGLLPAWFSSRTNVNEALQPGSRGSTAGRAHHRLRHALIVAEVALALVLLSGAGFFLRGLDGLLTRDPGWRTAGLLTGSIALRGQDYATNELRRKFYDRLEEKLAALPGVERVAFGTSLPTWGFSMSHNFVVEGRPEPAAGTAPLAFHAAITPDYFATLGLRLVRGRTFTAADRPDKPAVVIINESMARTFWPGQDPIGQRLGGPSPFLSDPREVVGVVSDAGAPAHLGRPDTIFQMYRPLAQTPDSGLVLAVRTRQEPGTLIAGLRRAVAEIDPDLPITRLDTLHGEISRQMRSIRLAGETLAGFALLGLVLAAVGIYGVISRFVVQRTNEIGIRMALGAQPRDVLGLVLGEGLRLALFGVAIGLAGAFGVARLLRAMAPNLPPAGLATACAVTVALVAVAALACWLPARRAARVNPVEALRAE